MVSIDNANLLMYYRFKTLPTSGVDIPNMATNKPAGVNTDLDWYADHVVGIPGTNGLYAVEVNSDIDPYVPPQWAGNTFAVSGYTHNGAAAAFNYKWRSKEDFSSTAIGTALANGDFTFGGWIKPKNKGPTTNAEMVAFNNGATSINYTFDAYKIISSNQPIRLRLRTTSYVAQDLEAGGLSGTASTPDDFWHYWNHVTFVVRRAPDVSGFYAYAFVNGELTDRSSDADWATDLSANTPKYLTLLGHRWDLGSYQGTAAFRDFFFFDRVLASGEIQDIFNNGIDEPTPTSGTYYIMPNHSTASDSNAGTDPDNPWATVGKVNGHNQQPGDYYRFAGTFRTTLLPKSGLENTPIVYTNVEGSGLPIFNGTLIYTGFVGPDGNGEYTLAGVTQEPNSCFSDGVYLTQGTFGSLNAGEWDWDSNTLYVKDDPAGNVIEASKRAYGIWADGDTNYSIRHVETFAAINRGIHIENVMSGVVETEYTFHSYHGDQGIYVVRPISGIVNCSNTFSHHVTTGSCIYANMDSAISGTVNITNIDGHNNGSNTLYIANNTDGGVVNVSSGNFRLSSQDGLFITSLDGGIVNVDNFNASNNTTYGVNISHTSVSGTVNITNANINNNLYGVRMWQSDNMFINFLYNKIYDNSRDGFLVIDSPNTYISLYYNLFYGHNDPSYAALHIYTTPGCSGSNNTFVNNNSTAIKIEDVTSIGWEFYNNIIADNLVGIDALLGSIPVVDYCCLYNNATQTIGDGTGALGSGVNNITVDPLLKVDYSLSFGSPCIDTGINLGLPRDIDGTPVPMDCLVDMGAYESAYMYTSSISPAAGSPDGGDLITITGGNFLPGSTVTFDGILATDITYLDCCTITCLTPPHEVGVVDVVIYNGCSTLTIANGFTYVQPFYNHTNTVAISRSHNTALYTYEPIAEGDVKARREINETMIGPGLDERAVVYSLPGSGSFD